MSSDKKNIYKILILSKSQAKNPGPERGRYIVKGPHPLAKIEMIRNGKVTKVKIVEYIKSMEETIIQNLGAIELEEQEQNKQNNAKGVHSNPSVVKKS